MFQSALLRRDREVEQGQYGSVAVDIVDVREAGGPDDGPHGDHRNLLCTFEVAHQLMSRRQKRAKAQRCAALLSVGQIERPLASRARLPGHQCRSSSIKARALSRI
jgi:hypothetical protein